MIRHPMVRLALVGILLAVVLAVLASPLGALRYGTRWL